MRYASAIEAHVDQQYGQHVESHRLYWSHRPLETREEFLSVEYQGEGSQFDIAREVGLRVAKEMGELVSFGVFDNCREHGITVTSAGGWTFCVYEHRNSDEINIEGCPTGEIQEWGPYGGENKYDTLYSTCWMDYDGAAKAMITLLKTTVERRDATRLMLKGIVADTRVERARA
jgi:hypothetical protein